MAVFFPNQIHGDGELIDRIKRLGLYSCSVGEYKSSGNEQGNGCGCYRHEDIGLEDTIGIHEVTWEPVRTHWNKPRLLVSKPKTPRDDCGMPNDSQMQETSSFQLIQQTGIMRERLIEQFSLRENLRTEGFLSEKDSLSYLAEYTESSWKSSPVEIYNLSFDALEILVGISRDRELMNLVYRRQAEYVKSCIDITPIDWKGYSEYFGYVYVFYMDNNRGSFFGGSYRSELLSDLR